MSDQSHPETETPQRVYCYVSSMDGMQPTDALRAEPQNRVRTEFRPIAKRRILRKIAESEDGSLGDLSTRADRSVVDESTAHRIG